MRKSRSAVLAAIATEHSAGDQRLERARAETRQTVEQETREATLRTASEALNQALRRFRQTPAQAGALRLLAESSVAWAERLVVLAIENGQARSIAVRGIGHTSSDEPLFTFEIDTADAIGSSLESKDPVIALARVPELPPALAEAFGDPGGRAYLFPVVSRQQVIAMLIAAGKVTPAPLELLCEAAGMKIEALLPEPARNLTPLASPELVRIASPKVQSESVQPESGELKAWDDLTPEDQRLHLQAQRIARVRVAEIRLNHAAELQKGLFEGNIYGSLRSPIDRARTDFLQTFLSKSSTMVDYLHLEILRSLANEDDRLLGHEYPGPMV